MCVCACNLCVCNHGNPPPLWRAAAPRSCKHLTCRRRNALGAEVSESSGKKRRVRRGPEVRLFRTHVGAGVVPVVPAALRRSGSERGEDGGEPLEAPAGPAGEPDPRGPHRPAGLGGGGGLDGGAERSAGDEPGSDPSAPRLRGAVRPRRGGRIGGCGRDLVVPCIPAGGGATAPGAVGRSDWSAGETPDSPVEPSLAQGAAEGPGGSRPLDCGDPN